MALGDAVFPTPPASSQEPAPSSSIPSSPTRPAKRKARPTVTPRSFRRFFTPRNADGRSQPEGSARDVLADITRESINRQSVGNGGARGALKSQIFDEGENPAQGSNLIHDLDSAGHITPESSPIRYGDIGQPGSLKRKRELYPYCHELQNAARRHPTHLRPAVAPFPAPVKRSNYRDALGAVSMREQGIVREACNRLDGTLKTPWQPQVASFYSSQDDIHYNRDLTNSGSCGALPFTVAACNTNSLVAVGDEEGCVRLLETDGRDPLEFRKAHLAFQPHRNAIIDLVFSDDDRYLATASGDQSCMIIDMSTQESIFSLRGHLSSTKQVRFQPGSGNKVIATSSRDGNVMIWDLRCKGRQDQQAEHVVHLGGGSAPVFPSSHRLSPVLAPCVGSIFQAHADVFTGDPSSRGWYNSNGNTAAAPSTIRRSARGNGHDISVTAVSFLDESKPHLLLTGSEASATVKMWDLRAKNFTSGRRWMPVGSTRQPEVHTRHRNFGLTSMSLNTDCSRLYTLCKDHSLYAYSIEHLFRGTHPERQPHRQEPKEGLGPLYAFRHPKLKVASFYIKSALRPTFADNTELLAVSSSEACAVVFPTDEKLLQRAARPAASPASSGFSTPTTISSSGGSGTGPFAKLGLDRSLAAELPVSQYGTALVRGHEKEVTALTWTSEGELVTLSDDNKCRVWRERGDKARELRNCGEGGGARWLQGWADIQAEDPHWDEEE